MTTQANVNDDAGRDGERPLRADAERNRRRIIAAAHTLFAERGLDVSLDDVAAAAGVGVGTVYRRFANRDELITGVFVAHLEDMEAQTEGILDADPWDAIVAWATTVCTAMAEDRGLTAIMIQIDHTDPAIATIKTRLTDRMREIFARAKAADVLRPDIEQTDFHAIFTMVSSFAADTEATAPGTWRRYLGLLLDAVHADRTTQPLHTPPLTEGQIRAIQECRLASRRREV